MTALPTSKEGVVAAISALAARKPQSREEMKAIEADSVRLALHIQKHTSLSDVPEQVWHFLADAAVRFKDSGYAEAQLAVLDEALSQWLSGAQTNASDVGGDGRLGSVSVTVVEATSPPDTSGGRPREK